MSGFKIIVYRLHGVFRDTTVHGPIQPVGGRFGYSSATIMPMMHGLIRAVADYRLATRLGAALRLIRCKQFGRLPVKIRGGN